MLFEDNIDMHLSIDETSLSNGELYTILTKKSAKGCKGAIVAMVKGTKTENVISVLKKISKEKRDLVREVTLDLASSMNKIVSQCFPKAIKVIDRFHVQKLAFEALQQVRINHRWDAIDQDNEAKRQARYKTGVYAPFTFINGDTKKQLLARSRFLLFKSPNNWTESQKIRAKILFAQHPDIEKAFSLCHSLRMIFSKNDNIDIARTKLAKWHNEVDKSNFKTFETVSRTIQLNYNNILNYFRNRSTNASAESFNAKLKGFRALLRGVTDINFFLYRVAKIYA